MVNMYGFYWLSLPENLPHWVHTIQPNTVDRPVLITVEMQKLSLIYTLTVSFCHYELRIKIYVLKCFFFK